MERHARPEAPKAEPVEADDFGDALLAFLFGHGLKVALDVSEIEALRQSAIRAKPEAPKVEQEPAFDLSPASSEAQRHGIMTKGDHEAWTRRMSEREGGLEVGAGFELCPDATHLNRAPSSDELLEAIDMDDFNIVGEWIESGEKGSAPSGRVKGLWQSMRRVVAIAKHKGPQS